MLLRAAVLMGTAAILIAEGLSAFGAITPVALAIAWCCALLLQTWRALSACRVGTRADADAWRLCDLASAAAIAAICAVVFTTAILSPPNSADAMAYHIPRVIYWAQQRSVAFFPTPYLNQIMLQPIAEYMMLQLYELTGGDRLLNLVQFFGFIGSIVGVWAIAGELGLTRRGQMFAALFCATLPSAILQASGAKNDCLLAFWLVCMVYFAIRSTRTNSWADYLLLGCSTGLSLGTKATAYLFAPFLLIAIFLWTRPTWGRVAAATFAGIVIINGPQFVRNLQLSGSLLGFDSAQGDGKYRWRNEHLGWKPAVSNLLRHASEQLGVRNEAWNNGVYASVLRIHAALGIDPQDPDTTWPLTRYAAPQHANHEANANNHWHLLILCVAFGAAVHRWWRVRDTFWILYAASLLCGFLAFCLYLKWQPFLSRLELPLFVLAAPLAAFFLEQLRIPVLQFGVCLLLLNNARPFLFENWTRPLKGPHTLFTETRDAAYFNDMVQWNNRDSYMRAVDLIAHSGCKDIGLDTNINQLEYPFQALLRERSPEVQFEHVGVENASARYYKRVPHPCVVLCLDCAGIESKRLEYAPVGSPVEIGKFLLFMPAK